MTREEKPAVRPRAGIVNLERRKHPRFDVDLPIEYHREASPGYLTGRVRNAGEGGLLVYLPERMEVGQHLKMKVFFTMGTRLDTIEALTQVVWADFRVGKDWGDYRCGVQFIDISEEDVEKLGRFLMNLSG